MKDVTIQRGGFYGNVIYYGVTDSMYFDKKYWSSLNDNGLVGKTLDLGKND